MWRFMKDLSAVINTESIPSERRRKSKLYRTVLKVLVINIIDMMD